MPRYFRLPVALFLLLPVLVAAWFSFYSHRKPDPNRPDLKTVERGVILVRFKNSVALGKTAALPASFVNTARDWGYKKAEPAFPFLSKTFSKTASPLQRTVLAEIGDEFHPWDAAQALREDPNVELAEPVYLRKITAIPNDPQYAAMSYFQIIKAEGAWDAVKGEQGAVLVAVTDGGTDSKHPDLADNIWKNPKEIAGNSVDDDANGYVDDVSGWNFANATNDPKGLTATPNNAFHGTHTAGSLAGRTNNGVGVASLSWNVKLLPINVSSKSTDDALAYGFQGIVYAADMGAKVISCSWGGSGSASETERTAIQYALSKGALVVAAAGNGGDDGIGDDNDATPEYPANYEGVLAVGATSPVSDKLASYSNYGHSVDVFAPGSSILSTTPNSTYSNSSGTSMATPIVSALAGLVATVKPDYTPLQIAEQIRVTTDDIRASNTTLGAKVSGGRINAQRAVTDFSKPSLRLSQMTFSDGNNNGIVNINETIALSLTFQNILPASAQNTTVKLSTTDTNVQLTDNTPRTLGAVSGGGTGTATGLAFRVTGTLPDGYVIHLLAEISGTNYTAYEPLTLVLNPPRFVDHNTGKITMSVTTRGNIGYNGFQDATNGKGFRINGKDVLFEGGLMLGTSSSRVSDVVRGADGETQDNDYQALRSSVLSLVSPGKHTVEETQLVLSDSLSPNPLRVLVTQETLADTTKANRGFVLIKYTVKNIGTADLNNLRGGIFMDWDVATDALDYARYDATQRMGYAMNAATSPTLIAATKLLNTSGTINFRAVNNDPEIYGGTCTGCNGFTNTEKWNYLSTGIQTQSLDKKDVSTLLGVLLGTLQPGQSAEMTYALIGATSLADLNASAQAAQSFYDRYIVANEEETPTPDLFTLSPAWPNPFSDQTTLQYRLQTPARVTLSVYDLLGREVSRLVDEHQGSGTHSTAFRAHGLPSGLYIARLKVEGTKKQIQTQKLVVRK